MNRLQQKISDLVGDITIEDLVVCPIDDHVTIGVQLFLPQMVVLETASVQRPLLYINNVIIDPTWLILE